MRVPQVMKSQPWELGRRKDRRAARGRAERPKVMFRKWMAPVLRRETGASAVRTETVGVDLVADIYSAETGHPSPAAGFDHHDAAEAAPVAMAPMAVMATHSTTTLAATGGSFGRDERRGADSGDGDDSEHCLADHRSLQVFIGCVLTSAYSVARMIRRVLQRADFESQIDHFVMAITERPGPP